MQFFFCSFFFFFSLYFSQKFLYKFRWKKERWSSFFLVFIRLLFVDMQGYMISTGICGLWIWEKWKLSRRRELAKYCKRKPAYDKDLFTFIVQIYFLLHRLPTCIPCRSVKKRYTGKVESCLPLHLNLSSRIESIFRFCALFGVSHLAPDVSMGCAWRYALSQRRLQSQMNGFLARCLRTKETGLFEEILAWKVTLLRANVKLRNVFRSVSIIRTVFWCFADWQTSH